MIQNLTQSASDQTNVVIQTNETNDADLTQAAADQGVEKLVAKLGEITTRIENKAVI